MFPQAQLQLGAATVRKFGERFGLTRRGAWTQAKGACGEIHCTVAEAIVHGGSKEKNRTSAKSGHRPYSLVTGLLRLHVRFHA